MMNKSLYDISWKVIEEEYRANTAYSYSTLSKFNREGFSKLNKLFNKEASPSLMFGGLVDTLLTDSDNFNNRYLVAEFPKIPESLTIVVTNLFNSFKDLYSNINDIPDEEIVKETILNEYHLRSLPPTRVKGIKEKGEEYYSLLHLSTDKTLINQADYQDSLNCVTIIKNSEVTKNYFAPNNPFDTNIERFYQLKFKGEYEGIPIRCMSDLLIVDHENKIITPCDLKTTSYGEWEFYNSFIKYGYWIQAQLYWEIIRQNLDKDDLYKDYKLADYEFIVVSRYNCDPLIWKYPHTTVITDCIYGSKGQHICKNWRKIIKELHYYLTTSPKQPLGIDKINNIVDYLNKM